MADNEGRSIHIPNIRWLFGILRCCDRDSSFYWSNHIINIGISEVYENHLIHYKAGSEVCTFYVIATYEKIWIHYEYINPNQVKLDCINLFYL